MKVKVKVFAGLRDLMPGEQDVNLAGRADISVLLEQLCLRHPGLYEELFDGPGLLKPYVNVLKNGRNTYFIGGLGAALEDGDVVAVFPPVAGG